MIKTDYEVRAMKFANKLAELFEDCHYLRDYVRVISHYNKTHVIKLKFDSGISRIAIIRSDYVVKFDYGDEFDFGNCASEGRIYAQAVEDGMEHLFAKTTVFSLHGHSGCIMPRVKGINNRSKYWGNYCTDEEYWWLRDHVCDLHRGNVGYRNGKVCIIDYAAG